jgi:hypothetical protein
MLAVKVTAEPVVDGLDDEARAVTVLVGAGSDGAVTGAVGAGLGWAVTGAVGAGLGWVVTVLTGVGLDALCFQLEVSRETWAMAACRETRAVPFRGLWGRKWAKLAAEACAEIGRVRNTNTNTRPTEADRTGLMLNRFDMVSPGVVAGQRC